MKAADFANSIYDLFPPFREWSDATLEAWTNSITRECGGFAPNVRQEAFKNLTRARQKEKPPQVATIVEACVEAKRWLDAEARKQGKLPVAEEGDEPNDYGHATANRLIKEVSLGRQAAQEGWIGELHAFICQHGRLPQGSEIGVCKAESKDTDRFIATALRDAGSDPKNSALAIVGQCAETILKRREELAQRALGSER